MDEIDLINKRGEQPIPSISDEELSYLIHREFPDNIELIRKKLSSIDSDSHNGRNRISASVLKLAKSDLTKIDQIIDQANYDYRDTISAAEYPRMSKFGFEIFDQEEKIRKKIFLEDWLEYSNWRKE